MNDDDWMQIIRSFALQDFADMNKLCIEVTPLLGQFRCHS